ncbi:MAG: AAA family ATPase [Actinomycetota bacterium]
MSTARLVRLTVSNYRSIGNDVSIDLEPLTVLVGVNGSGKSNLLDAARFVAHALSDGLESAIEARHGIRAVMRDAARIRRPMSIRLDLEHPSWTASYQFEIARSGQEDYSVHREHLVLTDSESQQTGQLTKDSGGNVSTTWAGLQAPVQDRRNLALLAVGGDARLAPVVAALRAIETYALFAEELRKPQPPSQRSHLSKFGDNWPSIVRRVVRQDAVRDLRLALEKVTGDIVDLRASRPVAGLNAVEFEHLWTADTTKWFPASRESDGTLRVAGILTALIQQPPLTLIGIEEPEQTVHAGVLSVLADFFRETSAESTLVITTHSPDLLDLVPVEAIRVVTRTGGITRVGRLDEGQQMLVRQQLESPGGLLRSQGLVAEEA